MQPRKQDGPFERVNFVISHLPQDGKAPTGDDNLCLDIAAQLGSAFALPSTTTSTPVTDKNTLYVAVNCDLRETGMDRRDYFLVAASNDTNEQTTDADFMLTPSFTPTKSKPIKTPLEAKHYHPTLLPTRVTNDRATAAADVMPHFHNDGHPVIAIMFRNPEYCDLVAMGSYAQSLQARHNAKFLISTGPGTQRNSAIDIQDIFGAIPRTVIFSWTKASKEQNPYMAMLGASTHLVTSGTISTTSDLLATGKPVYYPPCTYGGGNSFIDLKLKDKLCALDAVGTFNDKTLRQKLPCQKVRDALLFEWQALSAQFARDLQEKVIRRYGGTRLLPLKACPT